ncbi:uncharacterized protein [Palaemon carinicauda]|uniref:uncharacterized protein n=1 Tax=Palaemon carinicauda TaxID=392227 RepID=UPI0035B6461C
MNEDTTSKALLKLTNYIINLTSKRQVFVLYDDSYPEINQVLHRSYGYWVDTVVLGCNSFDALQFLLQKWQAYRMAMRNMIVFCTSSSTVALFQEVKARAMESTTVTWFVISRNDIKSQLEQVLREGTQISLFTRQTETKYDMAITKVDSSSKVRIQSVGMWWTDDKGTHSFTSQPLLQDLPSVYSSFHGRHLIVSANNNWPFFGLRVLADRKAEPTSGIDVNILNALSRKLNFSYQVEVPPDRAWGGPQKDGSVTGLIGVVARQESHFAICEITITDLMYYKLCKM